MVNPQNIVTSSQINVQKYHTKLTLPNIFSLSLAHPLHTI